MDKNTTLKIMLILSIMGVLFAGFLTITKLILGVCPLKESCPFLLGYPVCVYGLVLFTIITISIIMIMLNKNVKRANKLLLYTSTFGVAFSFYYSYQELFVLTCPGGCEYTLGMPSCIYGLIMYTAILVLNILYSRKDIKITNKFLRNKKNKKSKRK